MKPYANNPRQISQRQYADLRRWLGKFGDLSGIVHDLNSGEIVGGNQRARIFDVNQCEIVLTSQLERPDEQGTVALGYVVWQGKAYAYRQVRWSTDQCKQANIIANKAGGSWDWDLLANNFEVPELLEWGFEEFELGFNANSEKTQGQDAGPQIDKAQKLQEKWKVQPGDLWVLGEQHRVMCGDCTDGATVEMVMDGEQAQTVVTDPPYGQNQKGITNDSPGEHKSIIEDAVKNLPLQNGVCIAFSSPRTFPVWLDATRNNGYTFERMLWMYKEAQETYPWRGWLLKSEAILVSSIGEASWQDVHPYSHDCYKMSELSSQLSVGWHGSVKPLDVDEDLMKRTCRPNDIVYDGFLGSGTTLIACQNLNRRCRGIEIEPRYVAVTLERFESTFGITPERL